jgi:hypothetical protein
VAIASRSSRAAGSAASNAAPASIHFESAASSAGVTRPPPRGMSPLAITSTSRLEAAAPRCTTPDAMSAAYESIWKSPLRPVT